MLCLAIKLISFDEEINTHHSFIAIINKYNPYFITHIHRHSMIIIEPEFIDIPFMSANR